MSSTKIKLISLLILTGCVSAKAATTYVYKTPSNATIITNKKFDKPGYQLLSIDGIKVQNSPPTPSIATKTTTTNSISKSNASKFYKPVDWKEEYKKNFEYLKPGEQVEVLEVLPGVDSYNSFIEKGYSLIGESIFKDWSLTKNSLIAQAKKVGATLVTFSKYSESEVSYTTLDDPNNLAFIYDYHVLFYVKDNYIKNPDALGVRINDIPLETRKIYQRNTGVYVLNVTQGSKAYNANVLNEDVIIAINDNPILTTNDFDDIKTKELKKTKVLDFKILRVVNNELKEVNIPINFE